MDRMPKIGERVSYGGSCVVGPCIGKVAAIYPSHDPAPGQDEDDDDCRYVQSPFDAERWKVRMEIEGELPEPFVYGDERAFAPTVSEIEAVEDSNDR